MTYNLTQVQSATNVYQLVDAANTAVDGSLMLVFIVSLFIVALVVLSRRSTFLHAIMVSSWGSFILALFVTYNGMINFLVPMFFLVMASFSTFYTYTRQS